MGGGLVRVVRMKARSGARGGEREAVSREKVARENRHVQGGGEGVATGDEDE